MTEHESIPVIGKDGAQYRDKDWSAIETDARRSWEERNLWSVVPDDN